MQSQFQALHSLYANAAAAAAATVATPRFYICRPGGQLVPLLALDELPVVRNGQYDLLCLNCLARCSSLYGPGALGSGSGSSVNSNRVNDSVDNSANSDGVSGGANSSVNNGNVNSVNSFVRLCLVDHPCKDISRQKQCGAYPAPAKDTAHEQHPHTHQRTPCQHVDGPLTAVRASAADSTSMPSVNCPSESSGVEYGAEVSPPASLQDCSVALVQDDDSDSCSDSCSDSRSDSRSAIMSSYEAKDLRVTVRRRAHARRSRGRQPACYPQVHSRNQRLACYPQVHSRNQRLACKQARSSRRQQPACCPQPAQVNSSTKRQRRRERMKRGKKDVKPGSRYWHMMKIPGRRGRGHTSSC